MKNALIIFAIFLIAAMLVAHAYPDGAATQSGSDDTLKKVQDTIQKAFDDAKNSDVAKEIQRQFDEGVKKAKEIIDNIGNTGKKD